MWHAPYEAPTLPAVSVAAPSVPAAPRRRLPAWPWAILGLALVLRVTAVLATPDYAPFGDPADYDRIARYLADVGTYPPSSFADPTSPSALRPPGYPYLLAAIYEVFGVRWTVVRLVAGLLGTVGVWLLWDTVRRLWDARLATWTAAVAAVVPSLVWVGGGLTAESLFVPLVLASAWAAVRHRDAGGHPALVLAAGVLLGLAVVTRTNGVVLLLPLLVAAWVPRRRWTDPVVLLLGVVVALSPWTVRNAAAFGSFAPLGTQSGFTIAGAYNGEGNRRGPGIAAWQQPSGVPELRPLFARPGTDEVEVDAELRDRGVDYAVHHPGFVLVAAGVHGLQLFHLWPDIERASGNAFRETGVPESLWGEYTAAFWVFLVAVAAGVVVLVRRRGSPGPLWLWAMPVLIVLSVVPLLGPPRYRIPADPFLAILAATALLAAWDRVRGRRGRDAA